MTYIEFVEKKIRCYDAGVPVYTRVIAQNMADEYGISLREASAAVAVAIKRILMAKTITDLRFFQKGIYYRTKCTPFGEVGINQNMLIENKYISGDSGYETGAMLLYRMGLTTQIPNERIIASNKAKECIRKDTSLDVFVCPPKTEINKSNIMYLQTLDAIELVNKTPVDADNPYRIIANHIMVNNLDYSKLLAIADSYYKKTVILILAKVAGERLQCEAAS